MVRKHPVEQGVATPCSRGIWRPVPGKSKSLGTKGSQIYVALFMQGYINAENTIKMDAPPTDTICFHAQQCAEKYLKGFLAFYEIEFPKTHSLEDLVLLCKGVAPEIESELEDVEILSSYGVEVRYPDEIYYDIPKEDAQKGIDLANKVKTVVLKYLEGMI